MGVLVVVDIVVFGVMSETVGKLRGDEDLAIFDGFVMTVCVDVLVDILRGGMVLDVFLLT